MPKIQIITGSTRPNRLNKQVADWAYEVASQRTDVDIELVDIADYNLPLLDEPVPALYGQYANEHTKKWSAKIAEADGYIFIAPEYNHGPSGALKNAIDYLYHEWKNKPVGFVSYGAQGGVRAVEHLRNVMAQVQVATVQEQVVFYLANDFEEYKTHNPGDAHAQTLNTQLDQLVAWANALKTIRE